MADQVPGHRARLREKYLTKGLKSLTDEEVVELLLTLANPRRDCKPQAREALRRFGSLRKVLAAEPAELLQVPGLGPKNTLALRLVQDTARRFLRENLKGRDLLGSARETFDYLYHALRDRRTEVFQVIFLDAGNGVITVEEPFKGGSAGSGVDPQVIIRRALNLSAARLVCVHNHPSGRPRPSQEDLRVTRELILAVRAVGLTLVDHLIIGDNTYYSFSEVGLIDRFETEVESFAGRETGLG